MDVNVRKVIKIKPMLSLYVVKMKFNKWLCLVVRISEKNLGQ